MRISFMVSYVSGSPCKFLGKSFFLFLPLDFFPNPFGGCLLSAHYERPFSSKERPCGVIAKPRKIPLPVLLLSPSSTSSTSLVSIK